MLRAVAFAARLDFTIDPPVLAAIERASHGDRQSAPPRLIEEYYKILRAAPPRARSADWPSTDCSSRSRRSCTGAGEALWRSLAALDAYRRRLRRQPDTLTNAILLGSLLRAARPSCSRTAARGRRRGRRSARCAARRDVERLRPDSGCSGVCCDPACRRAQPGVGDASAFRDALTWLEIHGSAPRCGAGCWRVVLAEAPRAACRAAGPSSTPLRRRRRGTASRTRVRLAGTSSWPLGLVDRLVGPREPQQRSAS